ncbi:hypothetical protein ASPWEDRAFT_175982 [Aspergillus wentii DTO 134E9]|uniref:F-box domain-containing protein n=1 Tax=Aspergillus wentii DTO 134E9 TaxID=1073089 RepID=A0A1L9R7L8_ASPWE|nr:uncharacterized protein ASPWEDRAFT_175982 [Aspergillus wentii DTO 134E9]KAI9927502.1 hypothetical protein MW887_003118 [Aspergillus wentii]OJJ30877.1 hypothetical protein ASPWEDRAFT_175982 [Aspergillus wentii DTO 134E9]
MASLHPILAILAIPELIELILLNLDTRTLLTSAQRVCHQWHKIIANSKPLQQALFFEPTEEEHDKPNQKRIRNPFIEKIWPQLFTQLGAFNQKKDEGNKYLRESASWRRMLIQQPPTSKITVVNPVNSSKFIKEKAKHYGEVCYGAHLRMHVLYDLFKKDVINFCHEAWTLSSDDPRFHMTMMGNYYKIVIWQALQKCAIVVFTPHAQDILNPAQYVRKFERCYYAEPELIQWFNEYRASYEWNEKYGICIENV